MGRSGTPPVRSRGAEPPQERGARRTQSPRSDLAERVAVATRYRLWLEVAALCLVVVVAFVVRVEDLRDWRAHPSEAFFRGQPLLTDFDGYYYLCLARDMVENDYRPVDDKRDVPAGVARPSPPPLMSVAAATVTRLTGWPLIWVVTFLPVVSGLLLTVPLYILTRWLGGPTMALTATSVGLLSHYYVMRSSLAWFDTDCMNVTLTFAGVACMLGFATHTGWRRYAFLAGGLVNLGVFIWWWDSTPEVAALISLLPLAIALFVFYRVPRREALTLGAVLLVLGALAVAIAGVDLPVVMLHKARGLLEYTATKQVADIWPPVGVTISEQGTPSFSRVVDVTTGATWTLVLSLPGFALLAWRQPRRSLLLLGPLALGSLSFLFAERFAVFTGPVAAVGFGALVAELWRWRAKIPLLAAVAPLVAIASVLVAYVGSIGKNLGPSEPATLVKGMVAAGEMSPPGSVIWALWDHGYPLQYWARRGTVADGQVHGGDRALYNTLPLAADDDRLAANFMRYYVARGAAGGETFARALGNDQARAVELMKKVLAAGPEGARTILAGTKLEPVGELVGVGDWLRFFYPRSAPPVYLFLDWRLTGTCYWWHWLGTWDLSKRDGVHANYLGVADLREEAGHFVSRSGALDIDLYNGFSRINSDSVSLSSFTVYEAGRPVFERSYPGGAGRFEAYGPGGFGAMMEEDAAQSVFNRLYLRHEHASGYFLPVVLSSPEYQLWEVRADVLP